jgi:hypothetical protein
MHLQLMLKINSINIYTQYSVVSMIFAFYIIKGSYVTTSDLLLNIIKVIKDNFLVKVESRKDITNNKRLVVR